MNGRIAFFDFDGTLTCSDTFMSFARFAVGRRKLVYAIIKTFPRLLLWKMGFVSNGRAKEALFAALYRGRSAQWFDQVCEDYADEIDKIARECGMSRLKKHVGNGDKVYIVSASLTNWIEPWARRNSVTGVIATVPEVDSDGCLTGSFLSPNCYGAEKVRRIKVELGAFKQCETWAYSDSLADAPLLAMSDHPEII